MPFNGSNGKIPYANVDAQRFAVGLTKEELQTTLAFLERCMTDESVRKAYATTDYTYSRVTSAMIALRWRLFGRQ